MSGDDEHTFIVTGKNYDSDQLSGKSQNEQSVTQCQTNCTYAGKCSNNVNAVFFIKLNEPDAMMMYLKCYVCIILLLLNCSERVLVALIMW